MKIKRIFVCGILILLALSFLMIQAFASEDAGDPEGMLLKTVVKTQLKERPADDSGDIMELPPDTPVVFYGEETGKWKKISFREQQGYIKSECLAVYGDAAGIRREFEGLNEYFLDVFEEIKLLQQKEKEDGIWNAVMIFLLVAVIFTVLYSKTKKEKKRKKRRKTAKQARGKSKLQKRHTDTHRERQ